MAHKMTMGYSPCPNDTFIFYAAANGIIDCGDIEFDIVMEDVEKLNQFGQKGLLDISKLSFAAIGHLRDRYGLLKTGAALGRGCGPLIVARPGSPLDKIASGKVAVPGLWTTAHLLLSLFLGGQPRAAAMVFDRIMPAVARGDFDYGVIIHEGRFTYAEHGLVCLLDLGEWWEQETGAPIPLGGIAIKRSISPRAAKRVEQIIAQSLAYAWSHPRQAMTYIAGHAQEMDAEVIRQHIELYVNDYSSDIGPEGKQAIKLLFSMAERRGLIPPSDLPLFACA